MKKTIITFLFVATAGLFQGCNNDDPGDNVYENQLYLESSVRRQQLYMSVDDTYQQVLTAAIAKPIDHDVKFTYRVDENLVASYNETYGTDAVILPLNHYLISSKKDVIKAGNVRSGSITIDFVDVLDLDKEVLYVLPISIVNADLPILRTRATNYYVFRGAHLVNIVGSMAENYCDVSWPNPSVVTGMQAITMELLVKADWNCGTDAGINALIGIEGYFLLRVGNLGRDPAELQVCFDGVSGLSTGPLLPYNQWTHIAVTYDLSTRICNIYVNGELQSSSSGKTSNMFGSDGINLASADVEYPEFHIGKAYNNNRYIGGSIAEVRIWNRALSAEEVADQQVHPYYVDPTSDGLVAYWKFNEGSGSTVVDRTGNGNDAIAAQPIVWNEVAIPE